MQDFKDRFDKFPDVLQFDEGAEFKNKFVNKVLEQHEIKHFWTHSKRQASIVERVNRTLQEKIRKIWDSEEDKEWVSHLYDVVESYNTQKHTSIGMSPKDVNEENKFTVWGRQFGVAINKPLLPKFKVGDLVRVYHFELLHRATPEYRKYYKDKYGPLPRTYMVQEKPIHPFSKEIFRITKVVLGDPVVYKLRSDAADENILGTFYEGEMSKVLPE